MVLCPLLLLIFLLQFCLFRFLFVLLVFPALSFSSFFQLFIFSCVLLPCAQNQTSDQDLILLRKIFFGHLLLFSFFCSSSSLFKKKKEKKKDCLPFCFFQSSSVLFSAANHWIASPDQGGPVRCAEGCGR